MLILIAWRMKETLKTLNHQSINQSIDRKDVGNHSHAQSVNRTINQSIDQSIIWRKLFQSNQSIDESHTRDPPSSRWSLRNECQTRSCSRSASSSARPFLESRLLRVSVLSRLMQKEDINWQVVWTISYSLPRYAPWRISQTVPKKNEKWSNKPVKKSPCKALNGKLDDLQNAEGMRR